MVTRKYIEVSVFIHANLTILLAECIIYSVFYKLTNLTNYRCLYISAQLMAQIINIFTIWAAVHILSKHFEVIFDYTKDRPMIQMIAEAMFWIRMTYVMCCGYFISCAICIICCYVCGY